MKISSFIVTGLLATFLVGCSGTAKLSSRGVALDSSYSGGVVSNILVLALLEDKRHESRVIIERGFVQEMKAAGINAVAAYTKFDSLGALTADPAAYESELQEMGMEAVLFVDPIRLDTDYDPGDYARTRSAYRALGLDTAASINLISNMAAEASAAKVVMNVGLWRPGAEKDLWNSTYDINAPGNYEIETAREYTAAFAKAVIGGLREHGFVK